MEYTNSVALEKYAINSFDGVIRHMKTWPIFLFSIRSSMRKLFIKPLPLLMVYWPFDWPFVIDFFVKCRPLFIVRFCSAASYSFTYPFIRCIALLYGKAIVMHTQCHEQVLQCFHSYLLYTPFSI